jgi:hypothetical protein
MTQQTVPVASLFPEVVRTAPSYQAPAIPAAPTTTALARISTQLDAPSVQLDANAAPFTCWTHLPPAEQAEARARAKELVDLAIGNPALGIAPDSNIVREYGNRELEPVNNLVQRLVQEVVPEDPLVVPPRAGLLADAS